jgi:hypothetical protein
VKTHHQGGGHGGDVGECAPDRLGDGESIGGILDCIADAGDGALVRVQDIVSALGRASFGPLLLVPALIVVTPLSGIPGLSSVGGIIIALISIQMTLGRDHVWLPRWIMRRTIDRQRFERALQKLKKPAAWIDKVTKKRITVLVEPPVSILPQALCVLCGAAMPFLEFVPMSSSLLAAGVVFFAVALVTRDGLVAILGFAMLAAAIGGIGFFIDQGIEVLAA